MKHLSALALVLSVTAFPAFSEGWSITKLGTMSTDTACMNKGRAVINRYLFDYPGGETAADSWSVYGYDLQPGNQDVVIICPVGGGDYVNAVLIIQSESEGEPRNQVADTLVAYWDQAQ
jgi:hypothetical protein